MTRSCPVQGAIVTMTKALAKDLITKKGIRVNAGMVASSLHAIHVRLCKPWLAVWSIGAAPSSLIGFCPWLFLSDQLTKVTGSTADRSCARTHLDTHPCTVIHPRNGTISFAPALQRLKMQSTLSTLWPARASLCMPSLAWFAV